MPTYLACQLQSVLIRILRVLLAPTAESLIPLKAASGIQCVFLSFIANFFDCAHHSMKFLLCQLLWYAYGVGYQGFAVAIYCNSLCNVLFKF